MMLKLRAQVAAATAGGVLAVVGLIGLGYATEPPATVMSVAEPARDVPVAGQAIWTQRGEALQALSTIQVSGPPVRVDYDRDEFGEAWEDVDDNGCDTRNDILIRDLTDETFRPDAYGCVVAHGWLSDPYTGRVIEFTRGVGTSDDVHIDHVVSLGDAWRSGANEWTDQRRLVFANDPLNLLAVDGPTNSSKSDDNASDWLPWEPRRCQFVARQVAVKVKYDLRMARDEHDTIRRVLSGCPGQPLPKE